MKNIIKYGDLFEITTSKGKAYLQYVYKNSRKIELVRVLKGIYKTQPSEEELQNLINDPEIFNIYFPVKISVKQGILKKITGNYVIPQTFSLPRFMRTKHIIQKQFLGWHIVNTETLERQLTPSLTPEQQKLSPFGIWNATLLIERLSVNWTLDNWE